MEAKKLRVLFVDDEELEIVKVLRQEGYQADHWHDVENLDVLVDGRYQVVFLDVRGIGRKHNGNGLDVLKYVATYNPLVYRVVFSAKPFTARENEITRQFADRVVTKDCTTYELIDVLDRYAKSVSVDYVVAKIASQVPLGWFAKWKIKRGMALSEGQIGKLSKKVTVASDATKIVANIAATAAILVKAFGASS